MKKILPFAAFVLLSVSGIAQGKYQPKGQPPAPAKQEQKYTPPPKYNNNKSAQNFDKNKPKDLALDVKKREAEISNIEKQYQRKIDAVYSNRYINKKDKERIVRDYKQQRDKEISLVYQRYNNSNQYYARR